MQYPVILLFGPTSVGKTVLLTEVFKEDYEIISADSMQVFKYMDIGTAKPSKEIRDLVPHHLIDIIEPSEQFNTGRFVKRADALIPEILKRGKIPVISGGTAFYLKTFMYGLPQTPVANADIRKELHAVFKRKGVEYLYDELKKVDPESARRIEKRDYYRIIRALEVYRIGGKPLSEYRTSTQKRKLYKFLFLGLIRQREQLYESINKRVDDMFRMGLKEEVAGLIDMGFIWDDPGMRGIGYREFARFQEGCVTYESVKEEIKKNSRRYAKRQITYLKNIKEIRWYFPAEQDKIREAVDSFKNKADI
ncbi:MAG: tRNA (adenosine(37)-N6)-dimethylallyltransferase MiaA [Spirochaetales bacterium]|nr:tRNA (adenosine(37)-N6)-dimethylallyltransferase MiaA [Spirochaetales bacterium]